MQSGEAREMGWRGWLPNRAVRPWWGGLLGAALAGVATAVRVAVEAPLGHELPFITYFPALIIASAVGGFAGGLTCLVVASLLVTLLLARVDVPPVWALGSFWIAGGLVIAVASALTDRGRELRA